MGVRWSALGSRCGSGRECVCPRCVCVPVRCSSALTCVDELNLCLLEAPLILQVHGKFEVHIGQLGLEAGSTSKLKCLCVKTCFCKIAYIYW